MFYFSFYTQQHCVANIDVTWSCSLSMKSALIEAPMNLQAYVLSATSIEVTWNRSGNKTTISNASYEISFEAANNNEHHQRKGFFLTSNQLFIVQNLHPFSEYLISVTSIDQTGARSKAASVKAVTFAAGEYMQFSETVSK